MHEQRKQRLAELLRSDHEAVTRQAADSLAAYVNKLIARRVDCNLAQDARSVGAVGAACILGSLAGRRFANAR